MSLDQVGLQLGNFLSYLTQRQQVIASNIANADTPGYKTRDIGLPVDFWGALQEAQSPVLESPDLVSRNDGNNVSIDREARLLSETTIKFSLATQMIRSEIKIVRSAIDEGRAA
jgi:flagellar basal-body rod protein FlgB